MRLERDSMGEVCVEDSALWGASTQRAVGNFPISGHLLPAPFIKALGAVKSAAANANEALGNLAHWKSVLIQEAAREIADGKHNQQFPVDVFQSGSGTSINTNANEVIALRTKQLGGSRNGQDRPIHPNDDVNMGQSSNDVVPTVLHISTALALRDHLGPALEQLASELERKSSYFANVVKVGRTHLMDATPMTLGQEFSGYAAQVRKGGERVGRAVGVLTELAIGGTAVGTGINAHPEFSSRVCEILSAETGLSFREARNHFAAQGSQDDSAEVAGDLAAIAAALSKIANDVRLLSSGPRAGLAELRLPDLQPGSSIMPGKVNPVMSEMLVQVCLYVQGLSQTVVNCCRDGHLELNATLPLIAYCLHDSISCLANGAGVFAEKCIHGVEANVSHCQDLADHSLMAVSALNPIIGYDAGARIAKEALATGRSIREVVLSRKLLDEKRLDKALSWETMIYPASLSPKSPPSLETWENEGGHPE
jgi:fumarate hydratase, class II